MAQVITGRILVRCPGDAAIRTVHVAGPTKASVEKKIEAMRRTWRHLEGIPRFMAARCVPIAGRVTGTAVMMGAARSRKKR